MGRFSPTVTAAPMPTPERGAFTRIVTGYLDARDRKLDREDRKLDREERKTEREERKKDREMQRLIQMLNLKRQGIVKDDELPPAGSGRGLESVVTPPPSNIEQSITPFNPEGARPPAPVGVGLEQAFSERPEAMSHEQAPPTAMPAAPVQQQKARAPGAFDPAAGQFMRPQRIPLGGGYSYDPSIAISMAEAEMGPELAMYERKKEIDEKYEDKAWVPKTWEEYQAKVRYDQAQQFRYSKAGQGGGGGGTDAEGLPITGREVTAGQKRRMEVAQDFAERAVAAFNGNVPMAVRHIESNPALKAEATEYGVNMTHYNSAAYKWAAARDEGTPGTRPGLGQYSSPGAAKPTATAAQMVTGKGAPAARPRTAGANPQMAQEIAALAEKTARMRGKIPEKELLAAFEQDVAAVKARYGAK